MIFVFALGCTWVKFLCVSCSAGIGVRAQSLLMSLVFSWSLLNVLVPILPEKTHSKWAGSGLVGKIGPVGKICGKIRMLVTINNSCSPWTRLTGSVLGSKDAESNQALVSCSLRRWRHVSLRDKAGLARGGSHVEVAPMCHIYLWDGAQWPCQLGLSFVKACPLIKTSLNKRG